MFLHQLNVLKRYIRLAMNRCEVVSGEAGCRNGQRSVVKVQMAQICDVEHGSQPFVSLCRAEVVLTDHRGVKEREKAGELVVPCVFGRHHQFTWLPAEQVVLQPQDTIGAAVRGRPCLAC